MKIYIKCIWFDMYKALTKSPTFRSTLKPRKPYMAYMDGFNHSSLDLKIDKNQKVVLSQGF